MELRRDSKLVRFGYFFSVDVPYQTTLCRFFWRTFVFTPLSWLLIIAATMFVIVGIVIKPMALVVIGVIVAVVFGISAVADYIDHPVGFIPQSIKQSTFVQGLKAVKGKVCPIIHIK